MDLGLTEAQEILKGSVADFVAREYDKNRLIALEGTPTGITPELLRKVSELGWLGVVIPEAYGGEGHSLTDAAILFDTGLSPRAVPGLLRSDPLARFTEADRLVHRLEALDLAPTDIDLVVLSHLHYDHAGGIELVSRAELVVQQDEYAYAHYPAGFFAPFYYRKNFDVPGRRWRLLPRGEGPPPADR